MKPYMMLMFVVACSAALVGCGGEGKGKTTEVTVNQTYFEAEVLEVSDTSLLVAPFKDTPESKSANQIQVSIGDIGEEKTLQYLSEAAVGDLVRIGYHGEIAESYPAKICGAFEIKLVTEEGIGYDKIPMVMVDGKLYYDTGKESSVTGRCGVMDGEITSAVDQTQTPTEDNQSNFGSGYGYQYGAENTIEININDTWIVFEQRDGDGSTTLTEPN